MAKLPIAVGNIKVPEERMADFKIMARAHFGPVRERVPGGEGVRPEFTDRPLTDDEIAAAITAELRQIWRERFRAWKRQQTADTDIDLS
jgi:hypothetical protein